MITPIIGHLLESFTRRYVSGMARALARAGLATALLLALPARAQVSVLQPFTLSGRVAIGQPSGRRLLSSAFLRVQNTNLAQYDLHAEPVFNPDVGDSLFPLEG